MGNKPNGLPDYREHPVKMVLAPPRKAPGLQGHVGRSLANNCFFARVWPFETEEDAARFLIERTGVKMAHETDYKPRVFAGDLDEGPDGFLRAISTDGRLPDFLEPGQPIPDTKMTRLPNNVETDMLHNPGLYTVADLFVPLDDTATTTVQIEHFNEPGAPDDQQLVLHSLRGDGSVRMEVMPRKMARHLDESTEDYHKRLELESQHPMLSVGSTVVYTGKPTKEELAKRGAEVGLPDMHHVIEQADMPDGLVCQTVQDRMTGHEYHRHVEADIAYYDLDREDEAEAREERRQRAEDDGPEALAEAEANGLQALALARIPIVVLESPYAGDIEGNVAYARLALFDCLERGEAPYASHLLYTQVGVLDDSDLAQRERGMAAGWAFLRCADRVVVYSDLGVSEGMARGIQRAEHHGLEIEYRSLPAEKIAEMNDKLRRSRPAVKLESEKSGPELAQAIRDNLERLPELPIASFPVLPTYEEATPWAIRFMRKLLLIDGLAKRSYEAARDQQIDISARLENARLRRTAPPPKKGD